MGRVTVDSYPENTTTDPATSAAARVSELNAIESVWQVPVVIGEMGYSNKVAVDDATQDAVLKAELSALASLPYLVGVNYWVGAGTDNSGGYTHIFAGSNGDWTLRPAGLDLAAFYQAEAQVANLDTARFNWENGTTQGWTASGTVTGVAPSAAASYRGKGSLAVSFSGVGTASVAVTRTLAGLDPGTPLALHVLAPVQPGLGPLQPFVVDATGQTYRAPAVAPRPGVWSTLVFTVPATAVAPLSELGLAFTTTGPSGTFYLDAVDDCRYAIQSATLTAGTRLQPHVLRLRYRSRGPSAPRARRRDRNKQVVH